MPGVTAIPDIREKDIALNEKDRRQPVKAARQQMTNRGWDSLRRPKGRESPAECADTTAEHVYAPAADEAAGTTHRGAERAKTDFQQRWGTVKESDPSEIKSTAPAQSSINPSKSTAPTCQGGGRPFIRERVKGSNLPKQRRQGGIAIKTRQAVLRSAKQGKAMASDRAVLKGATKQAAQKMKHHGQAQLAQQAQQVTKGAAGLTQKAGAAAAKTVASQAGGIVALLGGGGLFMLACAVAMVASVILSPFGIFFSDENAAPEAISPRAAIAQLNEEYAARLEAAQAGDYDRVDMSGQPPDWREVLAVFAVRTAGTENGVDVATLDADRVERLRAVFWDMCTITSYVEVIDHLDSDPEDDADDSWTERVLHLTVTGQTAGEAEASYAFTADQHSQLVELLAPENSELWFNLLYGYAAENSEIVAVALSQVGNVGGQPYWSWYGFASRVNWCACYVSWCANECGYIESGTIPKFAGCVQGSNWFKRRGQWAPRSAEPVPGMIIFFDWDQDGQDGLPDHVGIVERVEGGRVYTVEGNSGDQCRRNSYPLGWYEIYGYGMPDY